MDWFKKLNWPYILLCLLIVRGIYDFSFAQAILACCLVGYLIYEKWDGRHQKNIETERFEKVIDELKTNVSGLMIKNATKPQHMEQQLKRFF
jgi:hypothetical protein